MTAPPTEAKWKMVLVEPTPEMIAASRAVVVNGVPGHMIPRLPGDPSNWADRKATLRYRAMLAASPTPPPLASEEERLNKACIDFAIDQAALTAENARMREALEPFAKMHDEIEAAASLYAGPESDPNNWAKSCSWEDLQRAKAALSNTPPHRRSFGAKGAGEKGGGGGAQNGVGREITQRKAHQRYWRIARTVGPG